ncbi:M20 family metallopeptidase [Phycicoccus sp.]|uniref:M20 metallopeptidase family protein n=1 Tax=Phycicoccus sp. TaxID=1902410 RepID=UPI002CFFF5B1|nr:M20 family metallopeptidase [Phycicoccus sp.]HMM94050.1 M20 family metallopeptidase [Phycicoccus sp.]
MFDLVAAAADLSDELSRIRRRFHQVPELGLQLPQTQELLLTELADLPLEITLGESLTSVVAVLRGQESPKDSRTEPRPAVLLRSDMDALPVDEELDTPFRSLVENRMHACGHDLHMAMCIGAARLLSERRDQMRGDVVFMFQPGEEGHDGASNMLREGVLDAAGSRVKAAFALHVFSSAIPSGQFSTRPGAFMSASDDLKVVVRGSGGHGSTPHRANDPVVAIAEMVVALQTMVTRKFDIFDPVVVTVGSLHAGHQRNTISESAYFDATVRTFSPEARRRVQESIATLVQGIAAAHGVRALCTWEGGYPLLQNSQGAVDFARTTVEAMFGAGRYAGLERPFAASEDFARVLNEVPGAMVALSAVPAAGDAREAPFNHSPQAFFDEGIMPDGAALLAQLASSTLDIEARKPARKPWDRAVDSA